MINTNKEKRGGAKTQQTPAANAENRMETVFIKDVQVGMKNLTLTCIVLEVGPSVPLKENREVRTVKVADATACINFAVWDDTGHYINASDILRLTKVYASMWRNSLTLYTSKTGTIEKIGEFCMVFNDQLNMSEIAPHPPAPASSSVSNNGPNSNGGGGNNANPNAGYGSRNASAVPNTTATSGNNSSRYDPARSGGRNGQQTDDTGGGTNLRNRSGLDIVGLLKKCGFEANDKVSTLVEGAGTFVVAYTVHKMFAPLRISITLGTTPFLVRYLRRIGLLKSSKPK